MLELNLMAQAKKVNQVIIGQVIQPQLKGNLINELTQKYGDKSDPLEELVMDSTADLDSVYQKVEAEMDEVANELDYYATDDVFKYLIDGNAEVKLNKSLNSLAETEPLVITFEFDSQVDYYKVMQYFGVSPDTRKLMRLIHARGSKRN